MAKSDQIASLFAAVGFRVDQRSLQTLNKNLTDIEKKVNKLRHSISAIKLAKSQSNIFRGLDTGADKAAKSIDKLTDKYSKGLSPLKQYTTATEQLAQAFFQLRGIMPARLPALPRQRTGGGGGVGRGRGQNEDRGFFGRTWDGLFGGGGASFARGLLPGLGAGWAVAHTVQTAREQIANQSAMSALLGSAEAGKGEMKYLKNFSNQYGLRVDKTAGDYLGLLASANGTALQGKGVRDVFEGMAMYSKTLNMNPETTSRAFTALSQMISKGKVTAEELKGQLAESAKGSVQIFAAAASKVFGREISVAELFKLMEEGKILAEDILPAVAEEYKRIAMQGGALAKSLESSATAQAKFINKWQEFLVAVFNGGLDKALAVMFDALTGILKVLTAIPAPIWWTIAALGALKLAMLALPFAKVAAGFAGLMILGQGGFWASAIAGVKALGVAFMALGRMLFFQFLPVLLIIDTLEAFATGKKGLIRTGLEKSGIEGAVTSSWEGTQKIIAAQAGTTKKGWESGGPSPILATAMQEQSYSEARSHSQMPDINAIKARTQRDWAQVNIEQNFNIKEGDPMVMRKVVKDAALEALSEQFVKLQTSSAPKQGTR